MDLLLCVVVDSIGVVEPAVIGVPLLAVHHGVGGIVGLRQLVPVLHFDQIEVAAVFLTRVFLLTGAERSTLDTLPEGQERRCSSVLSQFLDSRSYSGSHPIHATHLCSIHTPGQVGQISQVGPWNLGSVHLQVPQSHVPLPLQICLLLAIQVELSREQSQALPDHIGSQTQTLHLHSPCPEKKKKKKWKAILFIYIKTSESAAGPHSPPHSLLLERSQLKLSHSQNGPLYLSSGLSLFLHSHVPHTQSPLLLQMSVVLSLRQVRSISSVATSLLLHSHSLPTRPSLHLRKSKTLLWHVSQLWRMDFVCSPNTDVLAVSTLIGAVTKVAEGAAGDTVLGAFALTDEVEGDFQLFCKPKGLDLYGLRFSLFRAALWRHTDAKCDLKRTGGKNS